MSSPCVSCKNTTVTRCKCFRSKESLRDRVFGEEWHKDLAFHVMKLKTPLANLKRGNLDSQISH